MSGPKSFVIVISEVLLVILMFAGAASGAFWGTSLAQVANPFPPLQTYFGPQILEFIGIGVGVALGFLGPAAIASVLFLLAQIQKNTRETAASLKFITEGASPPPANLP
jgi:hypothetical protein